MKTEKTCFKCLVTKPLEDFHKGPRMADGRVNKCKVCARADMAAYRQANLETLRADSRARSRTPERRANNNANARALRLEFPNRSRARQKVADALRLGRLKKQPCWVCGEKAHAHHPDYDRPLDVVWLCRPHHAQAHAITRTQEAAK